MLDLHNLVAAHVAGLDETERVVDAQRRQHTNVACFSSISNALEIGLFEKRDYRLKYYFKVFQTLKINEDRTFRQTLLTSDIQDL